MTRPATTTGQAAASRGCHRANVSVDTSTLADTWRTAARTVRLRSVDPSTLADTCRAAAVTERP